MENGRNLPIRKIEIKIRIESSFIGPWQKTLLASIRCTFRFAGAGGHSIRAKGQIDQLLDLSPLNTFLARHAI